jgi:hypothetical protein
VRRFLLLACLAAVVCVATAAAGGITLSTGQSDYTVQVGEEALFPIAVENTLGADTTGMLVQEVRFVPEGSEGSSPASRSQSRTITIFRDTTEITAGAGTAAVPGTFSFDIAFEYGNAPRTRVALPEIRVHVVSSTAEEADQQSPQVSSVSSVSTPAGSGGPQGGSSSSSTKQPGQMMQDMGSLREQAAQEQDRMQALRSGLLAGLEDDPLVREIHAVLTSHGYTRAATTINPTDEGTGTFSFEYRGGTGDVIRAGGAVNNGSATYAAYASGRSLVVHHAVTANETYRQYAGELADAGFFPVTSSMNATVGASSAGIGFVDGQNRTARIVATLSGGEVRDVMLEKPSDFAWLAGAGALCIVLLIAYLIRRGGPEAPAPAVSPVPRDPRGDALRLLEAARGEFERGDRKEAYGTAGRALRSYVSSAHWTGAELADGDVLRLLKESGHETRAVSSVLEQCGAVSYAGSLPCDEDFQAVARTIEALIRQD